MIMLFIVDTVPPLLWTLHHSRLPVWRVVIQVIRDHKAGRNNFAGADRSHDENKFAVGICVKDRPAFYCAIAICYNAVDAYKKWSFSCRCCENYHTHGRHVQ